MKVTRNTSKALLLRASIFLLIIIPGSYAIAQTCIDPPSGMVSWWPGDGNTDDLVGTNPGTLNGDATYDAGKVGQAFSLDGNGDYVSFGQNPAFDFDSGEFTVDFWVKFRSISGEQVLIEKFGPGGGGPGWTFTKLSGQDLLFWCGNSGACNIHPSGFTPGTWHHVAVTRSESTDKSMNTYTNFVDGVNLGPLVLPPALIAPSANELEVGRRNPGDGRSFFLNGLIDEIEIFNRALSPGEIQEIFNAGTLGKCKVAPDSDGDGVDDSEDLCANTVPNGPVDTAGCSDAQVDDDGDGVCDLTAASGGPSECAGIDLCDDTNVPESVPTTGILKPNHWALTDGSVWGTVAKGRGNGPGRSYTIAETAGCSCEQIIEEQGLGDGHTKHGCSISAMDDWVEQVR